MPVELANLAQYGLVAIYFAGGIINLIGPKAVRDMFEAWGYPRWFNVFTGATELLAAGLILYPSLAIAGVVLGTLVMLAALVTLAVNRAWKHSPGVFLTLVLTGVWIIPR